MLTDEQIASLSYVERRRLVRRLARPLQESSLSGDELLKIRRLRLSVLIGCLIAMVPWTAYLALALPHTYRANHWSATWVGFDVGLFVLMLLNLLLGWQRRVLVVVTSFATGVLLICDAWFDVMTAQLGDVDGSLLAALLLELPLGILFMSGAIRLLRLTAERFWLLEPGQSVWRLTLPLPRDQAS